MILPLFMQAQVNIYQPFTPNHNVRIVGHYTDNNANGNPEFLAILEPIDSSGVAGLAIIEFADSVQILWRINFPDSNSIKLIDADFADLDADGRKEIVLIVHYQALADASNPGWLKIFEWDDGSNNYGLKPAKEWDYRGSGISYLRPNQLVVANMDRDPNEELVIVTGNPERLILIAETRNGTFTATKVLQPKQLGSSPRPYSILVTDINGDLRQDILAIGHNRPLAMVAYLNGTDVFHEIPITSPINEALLLNAMTTGDLNGDGQYEIILPHINGAFTLVSMDGPKLTATALELQIADLVDMTTYDMDGDTVSDMIFLHSDGTVTTNASIAGGRLMGPLDEGTLSSPANLKFVQSIGDNPGFVLYQASDSSGNQFVTAIVDLARQAPIFIAAEKREPPPAAGIEDAEGTPEEAEQAITSEDGQKYYPLDRSLLPDPRALPPNRTPDILLYVGDEFAPDVLGDRHDQLANFNFIRKPPGMVFSFQRRSIVWKPTPTDLGSWNVDYEIVYQVGSEEVESDSAKTYAVIPKTEMVRRQILIYVNDKPRITTEPENLRLLAGQLFAYRIGVDDRNSDANIEFRLETGPDGMTLDEDGIISWRTNETHHDDYQVVVSIGDGFDRDIKEFTLNVNAKLTVISSVPNLAKIGTPYRYPVEYFQPGTKKAVQFELPIAPQGMIIDSTGLISWTPTVAEIDSQFFQVRIYDGLAEDVQNGHVFVNAPPRFTGTYPSVAVTMAGDTVRIKFDAEDRNEDAVLSWSLVRGPINMTIDSTGQLTWPTSFQNLDEARYTVEVSDGIHQATYRGAVFVNAPISFTSIPSDSATVGQLYTYPIITRDDNFATLLKFKRPLIVQNASKTKGYRVQILDDKFRRDLPNYVSQFRRARNIFINKPSRPAEGETAQAARIDLKQQVKNLFLDDGDLVLIVTDPDQGNIELEDILWEFFQGGRGIMPKVHATPIPLIQYTLREFPDGMTVDNSGLISWTPTPNQSGWHNVRLMVSDGFTRDDQVYRIYANYSPVIISLPDTLAEVDARYTYQVQVDDKNSDAKLRYTLTIAPKGMTVDQNGLISWVPTVEQLNWHEFEVIVSDGHSSDVQKSPLFANMTPRIISQPKPVALNSYEYTYRVVAEDLNKDEFRYRAVRIPRYSEFDSRTGLFKWRPKGMQAGPNTIIFEVIDARGGITTHEFQVHVFEDPGSRQFLFTSWPLLMAFVGVIFVTGIAVK